MGRGFLTYTTAVILQAVANGYLYGEEPSIAQSEPRPPRKYYDLTREGRELLAEAVKRYRLLEQTQPKKERVTKPSRA